MPDAAINAITERTVAAAIRGMTQLQGCQLWDHPANLAEVELSKEQHDLVGRGFAGPSADLEGERLLSPEQKILCCGGFDERQLRMIKAQLMHKLPDFHNVIDRAVAAKVECGRRSCIDGGQGRRVECRSTDGESIAATSIFLEDMHSFRL